MKALSLWTLLILVAAACLLSAAAPWERPAQAAHAPAQRAPAAPLETTPQTVLPGPFDYWTIGGGMVYWSLLPSVDFDPPYTLKRRPLAGTVTTTLARTNAMGTPQWTHLWADATGVFYINLASGYVEF